MSVWDPTSSGKEEIILPTMVKNWKLTGWVYFFKMKALGFIWEEPGTDGI